jgi:hypothetical protein
MRVCGKKKQFFIKQSLMKKVLEFVMQDFFKQKMQKICAGKGTGYSVFWYFSTHMECLADYCSSMF